MQLRSIAACLWVSACCRLHMQVPDAGAFGGMQMQQVVASAPLSSPMGAPQSAPPSAMDPDGSLTALLVDPSLHEPLQVFCTLS